MYIYLREHELFNSVTVTATTWTLNWALLKIVESDKANKNIKGKGNVFRWIALKQS